MDQKNQTQEKDPQESNAPLKDQVNRIEQEARMILPGVQALFGFQLISVFNNGFRDILSSGEMKAHLLALLLVAVSVAFVMAPAAYHRQAHHHISDHFVQIAGRFLAAAMPPLVIGICIDIYLIAKILLDSKTGGAVVTALIACLYIWAWFVFPFSQARRRSSRL